MKFYIFVLSIFLLSLSTVHSVDVTMYVTEFEPFINVKDNGDIEGFSNDYAVTLLKNTFGELNLNLTYQVLPSISQMFEKVNGHQTDNNTFAIGTSGITITKARDKIVDFLKFYSSGFQIMVKSKSGFWAKFNAIVKNVFTAFGVAIVVLIVVVSIFSPIAWFLEFNYLPKGKVPFFYCHELRKRPKPFVLRIPKTDKTLTISSEAWVRMNEFVNVVMWCMSTLSGVKTGYPKAEFTMYFHSLMKGCAVMAKILAIGVVSAIFIVSGEADGVKSFGDLGGRTICSVANETSTELLVRKNFGYTILPQPDIKTMLTKFEQDVCNTVVYDFPVIRQNANKVGGTIVGPVFDPEDYGIAIAHHNPYNEQLGQAANGLNLNHEYIDSIKNRWFVQGDVDNTSSTGAPQWLFWCAGFIGSGVLICVTTYMIKMGYDNKSKEWNDAFDGSHDMNYEDDFDELCKRQEDNISLFYGNDWILDDVRPDILMIRRMCMEYIMMIKGKDVDRIAKNRSSLLPPSEVELPRLDEQKENV